MSMSSRSDTDDSIFDVEELLHIEARCRELRREKDSLKETQSESFDLIKVHVRRLDEARLEDKAKIQKLENELNNCHEEIDLQGSREDSVFPCLCPSVWVLNIVKFDYLQDQLKVRNADVNYLEERVSDFEMKMVDFDLLEEEVGSLREELKKSNSQCGILVQELETKETQLQQSRLHIGKLEESIASTVLDYQCEIESLRLEMMSLDQNCFESKKSEDCCEENARCEDFKVHNNSTPHECPNFEEVVKELKEALRIEKLRAKEEAEDVAQEMAELRYQMTELLEEERKRRACIQQASLHRISELEAQLKMEQRKSVRPVQSICEA